MNPSELLKRAQDVLNCHRPVQPGYYSLFIENYKICLRRWSACEDEDQRIASLSSKDVNVGMTAKAWQSIQDRLAILHKKGIL